MPPTIAPAGEAYLPGDWKQSLLDDVAKEGGPKIALTSNVDQFLELWFQEEHGGPGSNPRGATGSPFGGANNPFDTSLGAPGTGVTIPGSTTLNSAGVQNYPDAATGLEATAHTLVHSSPSYGYGGLLDALADPHSSLAHLEATENTTAWGSAFPNPSNVAPPGYNSNTVGAQDTHHKGMTAAQIANAEGVVTPGVGPLPDVLGALSSKTLKIGLYLMVAAAGGALVIMGVKAAVPSSDRPKIPVPVPL
jgi:hypothetical protein